LGIHLPQLTKLDILTPMIDLHCHMLPGIDDGARSLEMALDMAKLAVADGITMTACTPHIYPGLFENTHEGIREACHQFQGELDKAGIALKLTYGADIQVVPELVASLANGTLPTLHGSRYFLFEPPHHVALPRLADLVHNTLLSGYVPIITHPERLAYIEEDYDKFVALARQGAWIQLTGGSLLGRFGPRVKKITEQFLSDGVTHLLASDGHNLKNRTPELREARNAAAAIVGEEEASLLVSERPAAVIANTDPADVPLPAGLDPNATPQDRRTAHKKGWFGWLGLGAN
jgi:protein-tyrosine phosphatase